MGCGGSKEQQRQVVPLADRPSQARPQSCHPSESAKPLASRPSTSNSTQGKRSQRSHPRPQSSRQSSRGRSPSCQRELSTPGSSSVSETTVIPTRSRRHGPERWRPGATLPIPEGPPPEDKAIHKEISTLSTLIDQHVGNFYHQRTERDRSTAVLVRQIIGQTIINSIVMSDMNGTAVLTELSSRLRGNAKDPTGQLREDHLLELCKLGGKIRQMIAKHPSEWNFGSWDDPRVTILFPSVLRDGSEVLGAEYL